MRIQAINDLQRHTNTMRTEINAALSRVVDSGWFVLGLEVKAFEQEFAEYCGAANCAFWPTAPTHWKSHCAHFALVLAKRSSP